MAFEPYQDLDQWDRERLETELENLHKDKLAGGMTDELYRECYDIILGEIFKRDDEETIKEAYERAMKGI